jgi:hypothetical protein
VERSAAERSIVTRGDAAAQNDAPVPFHRVLGRVRRVERAGEHINLTQPQRTLRSRLFGWLNRLKFRSRQ